MLKSRLLKVHFCQIVQYQYLMNFGNKNVHTDFKINMDSEKLNKRYVHMTKHGISHDIRRENTNICLFK